MKVKIDYELCMGDGNCAEVLWTFAGLSIPEQALLLFTILVAANIWQLVRSGPPKDDVSDAGQL